MSQKRRGNKFHNRQQSVQCHPEGFPAYAGTVKVPGPVITHLLVDGYATGPGKPRIGLEITKRRRWARELQTEINLVLSLPEALAFYGHLHAAIQAAQEQA